MRALQLRTVDEVIEALGGTYRCADCTGQKWPQAVSNWRRRQRFPGRLFRLMTAELAKRGHSARPELWNQMP